MFNISVVGGDFTYGLPVERILPVEYNMVEINRDILNLEEIVKNSGIIVFTGGEDVDPEVYEHEKFRNTSSNFRRDEFEGKVFNLARNYRRKMLGICRGSQFLWAMCGGSLIQDMDKHAGSRHNILDLRRMMVVKVNSTHHQSAYIGSKPMDVDILALSDPSISTYKMLYDPEREDFINFVGLEVEAWRCPKKGILGIQWHPEMESCPVDGVSMASRYVSDLVGI